MQPAERYLTGPFAARRASFPVETCLIIAPLLCALQAPGCQAQHRPAGGRISFSSTSRALGRVDAGGSATLSFPFRNTGSGPLQILGVEGDCGCMTPSFPKTVQAGGKAEISLRFEAEPTWSGDIVRSLTVRTNDASQPEVGLSVAVNVVPFVGMDPPNPLQLYYQPGQVYRKTVRLTPRAGSSMGLSNPTSTSPLVKARLVPPAAGDESRTYMLHLTIGPRKEPGDFRAMVKVQTTERRLPEAWLAVSGLAESGPVVTPSDILLSTVPAGAPGREVAQLQVFTRRGTMKLISVDTGTPALKAEIRATVPGSSYDVTLRSTGRWKSGIIESTIKVRTDDRTAPVMLVPFHAVAQ